MCHHIFNVFDCFLSEFIFYQILILLLNFGEQQCFENNFKWSPFLCVKRRCKLIEDANYDSWRLIIPFLKRHNHAYIRKFALCRDLRELFADRFLDPPLHRAQMLPEGLVALAQFYVFQVGADVFQLVYEFDLII